MAKSTLEKTKRIAEITHPDDFETLGMIFDLRISCWSGSINAKDLADKVAKEHQANPKAVSAIKHLMAEGNAALRKVQNAGEGVKRVHKQFSLPWTLAGSGFVPNVFFFEFREAINAAIREFNQAADEFVVQYPGLIEANINAGGTLIKAEDYPPISEIRSKFGVRLIGPLPMPRGKMLVLKGLEDSIVAREASAAEDQIQEVIKEAYKTLYSKIGAPIQKLYLKLREFKSVDDDGKKHSFKDSLIYNVEDTLDLVEAFNITNDIELNKIALEIEKDLCRFDPERLREDESLRIQIADKAEAIYKKILPRTF